MLVYAELKIEGGKDRKEGVQLHGLTTCLDNRNRGLT